MSFAAESAPIAGVPAPRAPGRAPIRAVAAGPRAAASLADVAAERDHFEHLAFTDDLTGVLNRRGLQREIDRRTPDALAAMAFAVVDVDGFRAINAAHGHDAGDVIVARLAETIDACRPADSGRLSVARIGADEFALVADSIEVLIEWALGILGATRSIRWTVRDVSFDVAVSIGVAPDAASDMWAASSEALFAAKQQGGDQLVVHDDVSPPLVAQVADRNWAAELRQAIVSDNLVLYGQPIFNLQDPGDTPLWFEALVRFRTPSGILVSPDSFIPAADRVGLLGDIDLWVTEHAIRWLSNNGPGVRLAVNVSARFFASPRALSHLGRCLEQMQVDPKRLCIEITESTAISDVNRCQKVVSALRRWGCTVAIDDFGSGFTSLPIARDLGVDHLKIDGSWVRNCVTDQLSNAVVTSIVEVASIIGASVIAEWVEDRDTLEYLSWLGVEFAQGYLLGLPAPLNECAPRNRNLDGSPRNRHASAMRPNSPRDLWA